VRCTKQARQDSVTHPKFSRMNLFHIFGSPSSIDRDILVFVDTLPELETSKTLAKQLAPTIQAHFKDAKPPNINFGILDDGVIIKTLKGIPDETNNAILATYGFHLQPHQLAVTRSVVRDLDAKKQRAARVILSFYSRTTHREGVKQALRGDFKEKCAMLSRLDFSVPLDFGKQAAPEVDIYKSIAFQLGQSLALAEGVELYTKEDIISHFPLFGAALRREPITPECQQALENAKQRFLDINFT
jgi:hypothetical protein